MRLRSFLIIIGLIGFGLVVIGAFGNFDKLVQALDDMDWFLIPLLVIAQVASYYSNARFYNAFFKISGHDIPVRQLFQISLAINFANNAIPAGGVAGTTYLTQAVNGEISAGKATIAQIGRYVFTFVSYFAVLALGFLFLFWGGGINRVSVRFMVLILLIILVAGLIVLLFFSERKRLLLILKPLIRALNWMGFKLFRRKNVIVTDHQLGYFLDELYEGYDEIKASPGAWVRLFGWALAGNLAEVATLYAVFLGFDMLINPGIAIAAYTIAIGASILGFVTGGVGVYEAAMVGALTALTIPFAMAFAVVIIYRGLSMLIFLPIGFYFYRKTLKK